MLKAKISLIMDFKFSIPDIAFSQCGRGLPFVLVPGDRG